MDNGKDILLSVQDLKVHFHLNQRLARAVDGASYEVSKGETVCIVGESGCGKTVSALSILGLIPQPPGQIVGGQVLFKGRNLLGLSEDEMQKIRGNHIAMVFQEPMTSLNPVFTIGDQVQEAITVHEEVSETDVRQRCVHLLRDVGIPSPEERLADYPHQLSGGQRQRVMIAMALACNPEVVIADEPTTALDVTIQAQILNLFGALQRERDLSLLYITHDLGVVANIADRIYIMYAGIIVEQGSAPEIFHDPRHPYTTGLMNSVPSLAATKEKRLIPIEGMVPDLLDFEGGCGFESRCPSMSDNCKREEPPLTEIAPGHQAACWINTNGQGG